ncbi:unnamed protein product [Linum tenue]|uniref:Uncharacterized protein n=1 Tax=Linum tenue TaxID=586396 RepID=A0AAV0QJ29_9ROSI|nr:unnamed protein product [Linum tenue]
MGESMAERHFTRSCREHFQETGQDETMQLMEMFSYQTDREYRIMMGTDIRIKRDPLAMRLKEDQIKQIWGGDPVYPTINYKQDPNEIIDYRGPDFHEPTPNMVAYLKELTDMDDAMARAVDIGENDPKAKKEGAMNLDEAIDDSENLTDFLMDFEEE